MLAYVILATLVTGILSGPIQFSGETCSTSRECTASSGKYSYTAGNAYVYSYSAVMRTSMPGSAIADTTEMKITSEVKIHAITTCEFTAQMTNVVVSDPNSLTAGVSMSKLAEILSVYPVRFSMRDGRVGEVCPVEGDSSWSVNLKRAIISSLQNTMENMDMDHVTRETDVIGDCPVTYKVMSQGYVRKVKDTLACKGRRGVNSVIQGTPYNTNSGVKSLPIMNTGHQCEQRISPELMVLTECKCTEVHSFSPFSSKQGGGAITEIEYSMTLLKHQIESHTPAELRSRSGLMYDHSLENLDRSSQEETIKNELASMCGQPDVTVNTPQKFSRLVEYLRRADFELLTSLATSAICPESKTIVRDALAVIGTTNSVKVIANLVSSGEVTGTEAAVLLSSYALIVKPSSEMIISVMPLVSRTPTRRVFIAISALLNNYCNHDDKVNCSGSEHDIIAPILESITRSLGSDCSSVKPETAFTLIKAISNIGHAGKEASHVLTSCAWNTMLPMKLRVASINAFQRFPCEAIKNSNINEMMRDINSDSELRIASYQTMMKCPDSAIVDQVHTMLMGEESNQVGSYVWTHLGNLRESASPLSSRARQLLSDVTLSDKFNMDKRKFSRNVEWSAHHARANLGGRVEADLLFSPKSFVPRSAKVALDADVFGQNLPLFQVDGRLEGVEDVLQAMLAPETMDMRKNLIGEDKTSAIDKATASWEVKMLGNTFGYGDVSGHDVRTAYEKINYIQVLLALAEHQNVDILKNAKFIDSSFTIPTVVGIPLRMRVEGVASISVSMNGKVDLRQMMASPRSLDIQGIITPSAAVTIKASMTMDVGVSSRSGVQLETSLFTSTGGKVSVVVKRGEVIEVDLDLPKRKTHLLQFKNEVKLIDNGRVRVPSLSSMASDPTNTITLDACYPTTALGLEACAQVTLPRPFSKSTGSWFPFTGPSNVNIYLNKIDSIISYHGELRNVYSDESGVQTWKAEVSAPGGSSDRRWSALVNLNYPKNMIKAELHTPYAGLKVNGLIMNDEERKRFQIEATCSSGRKYVVYADSPIKVVAGTTHMKPTLRLVWADVTMATLDGTVEYSLGNKFVGQMRLQKVTETPVVVKVFIATKGENFKTEINVESYAITTSLHGIVLRQTTSENAYTMKLRLAGKIGLYQQTPRKFSMDNVMSVEPSSSFTRYVANSRWSTDLWDGAYDGKSQAEFVYSDTKYQMNFVAGYDSKHQISYNQVLIWDIKPQAVKKVFGVKASFVAPFAGLEYSAELQNKYVAGRVVSMAAKFKSGEEIYLVKGRVNVKTTSPLRVALNAGVVYPGRQVKFTTDIVQTSASTYKQTGSLELAPELQWKITSIVKSTGGRFTAVTKVVSREMEPWIVKVAGETVWPSLGFRVKTIYGGHPIYSVNARLVNRGQYARWSVSGKGENEYERALEMSLTAPGITWAVESRFLVDSTKAKMGSVLRWSESDSIGMNVEASSLSSTYMGHLQLPSSIWWTVKAGKKDDMIRAELTSSVSGWEKHWLVGKVVVEGDGDTISTSGKIEGSSLPSAVRYEMSGKCMGNSHEVDVRVTTPFVGYELNSVKTWWTNEAQEKTLRSTMQFLGDTATFSVAWVNRDNSLSARIKSSVPWFTWTKDVLLVFKHLITESSTATSLEAGLVQDRRMRITANTNGVDSDKMTAVVTVQLPVKDSSLWTVRASNVKSSQNKYNTEFTASRSGVTLLSVVSDMKSAVGSYYGKSSSLYEHSVSVVVLDNSPIVWSAFYENKNYNMRYDVNLDYSSSSWSLASKFYGLGSQRENLQGTITVETPLVWLRRHQYTVNYAYKNDRTAPRMKVVADMTPGGRVVLSGGLVVSDASDWKFKGILNTPLQHDVKVFVASNNGKLAVTMNTKDNSWSAVVKVNSEQGFWYSEGTISLVTPLPILNSVSTRWSHNIASNQERTVRISATVSSPSYSINGAKVEWSHTSSSWTSVKSHWRMIPSTDSTPVTVFAAWQLGVEKCDITVDVNAWSKHAKWSSAFRTIESGLQVKSIWRLDSDVVILKTDIEFQDATSVTVSLETPWSTLPRLQLRYSGSEFSKFTESKWSAKWSENDRVNLVTRYRFTSSRTVFTYNLETPWSVIGRESSMKFVLTHPWTAANLVASFDHNAMSSPLEIKLKSDVRTRNSVKLMVNLKTPWSSARTISTVLKHNVESDSWTSIASLELPGYTGELRNVMKLSSSARSYSTDTVARYTYYGREHSVSIGSSLDLSSHVNGKLELKSTWAPISLVSMVVRHSNSAPWYLDSSIRLAYGASTSASVTAKLSGLGDLSVSTELTLAGSETRYIRLRHLASSPIAFESSARLSYSPTGKWSLQIVKSGNDNELTIVTNVNTPVSGWERITGRINHVTLSNGASSCIIKVTHSSGMYTLTCDVSPTSLSLTMSSPVQTASAHLTYGTPAKVVVSLNGKTITATGSYSKANGGIKSSIVAELPEKYSISMSHIGNPDTYDYTTQGEINMFGKPSISMSLQNSGTWDYQGETTGSIAYGADKYTLNSEYQSSGRNSKRKLNLKVAQNPFMNAGEYTAEIDNSITGESDEESTYSVKTPYIDNGRFSAKWRNTLTPTSSERSIVVNTPLKHYSNWEASMMKQISGRKTSAGVTLVTPLTVKTLSGRVEHEASSDWSNVDSSLTSEYNGHVVKVTLEMDMQSKTKRSVITISTPFEAIRSGSVTCVHSMAESLQGDLEVTHNGHTDMSLKYNVVGISASQVKLELPGVASINWQVDITHATPIKSVKLIVALPVVGGQWNHVELNTEFKVTPKHGESVTEITIKTRIPSRSTVAWISVGTGLSSLSSSAKIQWSDDSSRTLGYRSSISKSMTRRAEVIYKGFFIVDVIRASRGVEIEHRVVSDRSHTTLVKVVHKTDGHGESWTLKNVLTSVSAGHVTNVMHVSHPSLHRTNVLSITIKKIGSEMNIISEAIWSRDEKFSFSASLIHEIVSLSSFHHQFSTRVQHTSSKLDSSLTWELTNSAEKMVTHWQGRYRTLTSGSREFVKMAVSTVLVKTTLVFKFAIDMPNTVVSVSVQRSPSTSGSSLWTSSVDVMNSKTTITWEYQPTSRSVVVLVNMTGGTSIKALASCPTLSNVPLSVSRRQSASGEYKKWAEVGLSLDDSNKLRVLSFVNRRAVDEIKMIALKESIPVYGVWSLATGEYKKLGHDLTSRYSGSYKLDMPLVFSVGQSFKVIGSDVTDVKDAMVKAYDNDEFYARTAWDAAVIGGSYVRNSMNSASRAVSQQWANLRVGVSRVGASMTYWSRQLINWSISSLKSVENFVAELFSWTVKVVSSWVPMMKSMNDIFKMWLVRMAEKLVDIFNIPSVNDWFSSITAFDWQTRVWTPIVRTVLMAQNAVTDTVGSAYSVVDYAWSSLETVFSYPAFKWISEMAENITDNVNSTLELSDVRSTLVRWLCIAVCESAEMLVDGASSVLSVPMSGWTRQDAKTGNSEFQLNMPFELSSFAALPEAINGVYDRIDNLVKSVVKPMTSEEWSVSDTFYNYKPNHDVRTWLPPFSARATISGDERFQTFDGKHFTFSGDCSYLLTSDSQSDFKVYANYVKSSGNDKSERKSISVVSSGAEVEITKQGKIFVSGQSVELPYTAGDLSLKRIGNNVYIGNGKGMKVECELKHNWCTLEVSGWKYGKTSGMWGSYDNEPYTDMSVRHSSSALNSHTENSQHFAHSWARKDRSCKSYNNYAKNVDYTSFPSSSQALCDSYFSMSSDSFFRRCSRVVSPAPYRDSCLDAVSRNFRPSVMDMCSVAATYVRRCSDAGVPVSMPSQCSACASGTSMANSSIGTKSTLNSAQSQADVVIVMEQAPCNVQLRDNIKLLVNRMVKSFKASGINDVKFGVVGFGGKGVNGEVHVKTINGNITASSEELISSASNWQMGQKTSSGYTSDPLSAIEFASSAYSFRRGASKSLVVMTCSACHEFSTTFSGAKRSLLAQDIRVHLVSPGKIGLKVKSYRAANIYGADSTQLFTNQYLANSGSGNKALRSQAVLPRDLCVALAVESDGAYFDSRQVKADSNVHQAKSFMEVVANVVAKKGVPAPCQICKCVANSVGTGQSICHACDSERDTSLVFISQPSYSKME